MFDFSETLRALISTSQTLLKINGRWCVGYADQKTHDVLRQDIRHTVIDVVKLIRNVDGNENRLIGMAIATLERRAQLPQAA